MSENDKNRTNKIRSLVFICSLSAIVLVVSTYAWFVGTQTVSVSSFDVEIAAADSLLLSLDGSAWSSTVNISKDTLDEVSYASHMNSWGGATGIYPVSTIGELDATASRLKIYEKASFTATSGGYRLLASRVDNQTTTDKEPDGYVVFDLFVKNFSGKQYISELNPMDEEAIYLTGDSEVKVADTGGVGNTGIENSARVAFAQIGRVSGTTTDASKITGITCTGTSDVTSICRTAQIWEPNDKAHETNAINWYKNACLLRTGDDVTLVDSYTKGSKCTTVASGTAYETYAIRDAINSSANVDIYDGRNYNTYTSNTTTSTCTDGTIPTTEEKCISSYGTWKGTTVNACTATTKEYCESVTGTWSTENSTCSGGNFPTEESECTGAGASWGPTQVMTCSGDNKAYCKAINGTYVETRNLLEAYPYFTDTMKDLTSTNRPEFMTLAPNSITKVRVYVYIEGQDIDNYDFASIGKKISVNFGFTKERITGEDIGYDGPTIPVVTYYAVSFDSDGGTTIAPVTLKSGEKLPTITAPIKDGKTFSKWIEKGDEDQTEVDITELTVTRNMTLQAIYTDGA